LHRLRAECEGHRLQARAHSVATNGKLANLHKVAYSAAMPQARPALRRRYSVLVKRRGRASTGTWAWEIRRTPEQLAIRLRKDGFNTSKAALSAGKRALHTLLENLSGEKLTA
jgi:hypothetical protein